MPNAFGPKDSEKAVKSATTPRQFKMNATEFFLKYNKKFLDFDGVYGPQCVDVIKQYFVEVLGMPAMQGNAIDYWKDIPGFQRIKKAWFNTPKPGDIIVWNTTPINFYGHIAIINWTRRKDFGSFEQNYPFGSPCHYQQHGYQGVLGWLRPISLPAEAPRPVVQEKYNIRMAYLSDTDDIFNAAKFCNEKLLEFTGGKLGLEYNFKSILPVTASAGEDLPLERAYTIVNDFPYDKPFHWSVLGYYGNSSSPGYSTQTTAEKNVWFTSGHKPFPNETLLFELKHFAVRFYNQHRGSNPYIENYDNYKSADGGLAKVEEQIKSLIPYLSVFKI